MRVFHFSYRWKGSAYMTRVMADSPEEAKEKFEAVKTAQYDGEVYEEIPGTYSGGGIPVG